MGKRGTHMHGIYTLHPATLNPSSGVARSLSSRHDPSRVIQGKDTRDVLSDDINVKRKKGVGALSSDTFRKLTFVKPIELLRFRGLLSLADVGSVSRCALSSSSLTSRETYNYANSQFTRPLSRATAARGTV